MNYYGVSTNTLFLAHYGVKGMKWGVRRYQNKDRTLTSAGKKHEKLARKRRSAMESNDDANEIVRSLTKRERDLLGADEGKDWIEKKHEKAQSENIAKRFTAKDSKTGEATSFFEIWDNQSDIGQVAVATKSGEKYRGKGYASEAVKQGTKWFDRYGHKTMKQLEWIVEQSNTPSIELAKKHGFKEEEMTKHHPEWKDYDDFKLLVYKKQGRDTVEKVLRS